MANYQPGMMDYVKSVLTSDYANFSGRARRREYWLFYLFTIIINLAIQVISLFASKISYASGLSIPSIAVSVISLLWSIYIFTPSIALVVRRLHDINRSGWWYFLFIALAIFVIAGSVSHVYFGMSDKYLPVIVIAFILLVLSAIAMFVALILPGTKGENEYGSDPKAQPQADKESEIEVKF